MTTFRQHREQTVLDYHLAPENFAECVQYTPVGGSARDVVIHAESESDYRVIDPVTAEEKDELIVLCSRDPSAKSTDGYDRGGINNPKVGDQLMRGITDDPRQEAYTFTGEIRDQKRYKWRLVFHRRARPEQGIQD